MDSTGADGTEHDAISVDGVHKDRSDGRHTPEAGIPPHLRRPGLHQT